MTDGSGRVMLRAALACGVVVAVVVGAALCWDLVVVPRFASEQCVVRGQTAEIYGVEDGTSISPDSGGCKVLDCVDSVRAADRIILRDFREVTEVRRRC